MPFYGHTWGEVPDQNRGLYQPGKPIPNAYSPFSLIESTMLNQGFVRYWDSASRVPWLFTAEKHVFVSYEDPRSLDGGIMIWNYASDDAQGTLLKTIDAELLTSAHHRR